MAATDKNSDIPFWNVNVPSDQQTDECPDFLRYAFENEPDRITLATPDAEYSRLSWPDVKELINDNRLDLFRRVPSELRRYRMYCAKLEREYGSVMEFVLQKRLNWDDLTPKGGPFAEPDDMKILRNDWPYGLDNRIVHLVVWVKFELAAAQVSDSHPLGDLTPEARGPINDFVNETFISTCGEENVIWFKNWEALKSIHAVEHFHVMLFDPDMEFVNRITGDDVPLAEKVESEDQS